MFKDFLFTKKRYVNVQKRKPFNKIEVANLD